MARKAFRFGRVGHLLGAVLLVLVGCAHLGLGEELLPVPKDARPPQKGQAYWWPQVCIEYVWGDSKCQSAQKWSSMWAQGVDRVAVCNPDCQWIRGVSMYWLYWEWPEVDPYLWCKTGDGEYEWGDCQERYGYWVLGGAGLGPSYNGKGIPETLFFRDETTATRDYKWVKDLYLSDYKVGWWKE